MIVDGNMTGLFILFIAVGLISGVVLAVGVGWIWRRRGRGGPRTHDA